MKNTVELAIACICGSMAVSNAFTLDFIGYEGTTLPPNPLVINVPGYGTVSFSAVPGSSAVVNDAFETDAGTGSPSLSVTYGDTISVTFVGNQPTDVAFSFVGVSAGEYFVVQEDAFNSQTYLVTLNGTAGNGAGIYGVTWNQVPEPTSALLGALGSMILVLRRRR